MFLEAKLLSLQSYKYLSYNCSLAYFGQSRLSQALSSKLNLALLEPIFAQSISRR